MTLLGETEHWGYWSIKAGNFSGESLYVAQIETAAGNAKRDSFTGVSRSSVSRIAGCSADL